jgi:hypothetical protein
MREQRAAISARAKEFHAMVMGEASLDGRIEGWRDQRGREA